MMAWLNYSRLYAVIEWVWSGLMSIWRFSTTVLHRLRGSALAIGWRRDQGSRHDPELCQRGPKEKTLEGGGLPSVEVEDSDCEGQRKAEPEQRAEPEPPRELQRCGEEEEEDFDSEEYRVETTDELYCDYDSTWETEEQQGGVGQPRTTRRPASHEKFNRFQNAARDMQNYRHGYPSIPQRWKTPITDDKPNLNFYLGLKPSQPDGVYIKNFHDDWFGEYDTLEYVHTYIQWLFPLEEPGMNYKASTLTKEEVKEFVKNSTAKDNLLKSYKLMLDFYGIKLCDETTGEVERSPNWRKRFHNLNSHTHNNLRITRILKCQGILGFPHYQAPLVRFFLKETLVHGELPRVRESVLNYFVFAVLDRRQRRSLLKFAYMNYDQRDEFVWCPKKIQMAWLKQLVSEPQNIMDGVKSLLNEGDRTGNDTLCVT